MEPGRKLPACSMILLDLFLGIVALLLAIQLVRFFRQRRSDHHYFLFFILSMILFIGIIAGAGSRYLTLLVQPTPRYAFGFGILLVGSAMYYRFIRFFCRADQRYPLFNRLTLSLELLQIVTGLALMTDVLLTSGPQFMKGVAQGVYILGSFFQIYMIFFLLKTRKWDNILIAIGGICIGVTIKWVLVPVALRDQNIEELRLFMYLLSGVLVNFLFVFAAFLLRNSKPQTARADSWNR